MGLYVLDHDAYLQIDNDGIVSEHEKSLIVTAVSGTEVWIYIDGLGTGEAFIKADYTNYSYPTGANAAAVKAAIDAKLTIDDLRGGAGGVTGSGTANYVAYWDGASSLTGSSNFTFSSGTLTVGTSVISPIIIGSTSASGTLTLRATSSGTDGAIIFETDPTTERARILSTGEFIVGGTALRGTEFVSIQKNQNAFTRFHVYNETSGTGAATQISLQNTTSNGLFLNTYSAGYTSSGLAVANTALITSNLAVGLTIATGTTSYIRFAPNSTEASRFLSTGEFLVGRTTLAGTEFISISKNQNAGTVIRFENTTSGTGAFSRHSMLGGAATGAITAVSEGYTTSGYMVANSFSFIATGASTQVIIGTNQANPLSFWTNSTKRVEVSSAGQFIAYANGTTTSTSTSVTFTSAHYGLEFLWSPSGTATATLPANGAAAGSWFIVTVLTDQTTTISAATADTLITVNDATADSVAFSTAGQKIGSSVKFISNGSVWIAINLGSTTMTVAT